MDAADFIELVTQGEEGTALIELARDRSLATARSPQGVSVVCLAVYRRRLQLAAALAERRSQPLDLFEATCLGDRARVAQLIAAEPSCVNDVSPDGFSPVGYSAFFGHPAILRALLEAGGRPDSPSQNAMRVCPIHSAAATTDPERALELSKLLLDAGADPNVRQQGGYTPLHEAALHGKLELLRLLLERGADPSLANDAGRRPVELAREQGHSSVLALLERPVRGDL